MYRMSYRDLQWDPVFLDPCRYTLKNGIQVPLSPAEAPRDLVRFRTDGRRASLGMPGGRGKISDAGYDQMVCLAASIPAYDHVIFRARVRILEYPTAGEGNGQEGLGLFFRDTLAPDPQNGYHYSNMAVCGLSHGRPSLFGRQGITADSAENVQSFSCDRGEPEPASFVGKELELTLEKQGGRLAGQILGGRGAARRRAGNRGG